MWGGIGYIGGGVRLLSLYVFHPSTWFLFLRDGIQIQKKAKPWDCSQLTRIFCSSSTCAIAKQKWVLWVHARWQRQSGLTVGSNHDVIVSDIGSGTCLPLFGVGPRSPIKAHKQLVTCACCWVAWTTDFLKLWAKAFLKMGFLPDPGPIHCLTGPKAYISQKSQDQEMLRQN